MRIGPIISAPPRRRPDRNLAGAATLLAKTRGAASDPNCTQPAGLIRWAKSDGCHAGSAAAQSRPLSGGELHVAIGSLDKPPGRWHGRVFEYKPARRRAPVRLAPFINCSRPADGRRPSASRRNATRRLSGPRMTERFGPAINFESAVAGRAQIAGLRGARPNL
jgi:hypothetical protein